MFNGLIRDVSQRDSPSNDICYVWERGSDCLAILVNLGQELEQFYVHDIVLLLTSDVVDLKNFQQKSHID